MKYLIISIYFFLLMQAQIKISGTVKDDNSRPLTYVNVFIENTFDGAMTNENGYFEFQTSKKGDLNLIATLIGYDKFSTQLKDSKNINIEIILEPKAVMLQSAVVTASSFSSEKMKGIVVTPVDIYTTPGGAADIFQSIKKLPGITQVSESAELYIRGGNPVESVTLIDGGKIYHPFTYESSYGGLFSSLNTASFKGMYFSSGGFSAKYGNALSGVLDLSTKDEPLAKNYNLGVSMAAVNFSAELPLVDEKLGLSIYSQKGYTKPIMWLNGSSSKFTTHPTSLNFDAKLVFKYSETGRLKIYSSTANDKQGVFVNRTDYSGVFNGSSKNQFTALSNSIMFTPATLLKSSLSYSDFNNNWLLGSMDIEIGDRSLQFRNDLEHQMSKNQKVLAGIEYSYRENSFVGKLPEYDYDISPDSKTKTLDEKHSFEHIGGYFEFENSNFLSIKNLGIIAGIRADHFTKMEVSWIDPRISLAYKINESSTLKFGSGIFQQLPDPKLYRSSDGNPNLSPMKAIHYILSYELELNKSDEFRIELYKKNYSSLPLEDEHLNYTNKGNGYAQGIDLIYKGEFLGIRGWISYGYIDTKRFWMDYDFKTRSDYDITHNFSFIGKYQIARLWELGLTYKLASGKPYTPVIGSSFRPEYNVYEPNYGSTNSESYPTYQRLDLRLSYFTSFFDGKFSIFYLEAINILDINNLFGYYYNPDYTKKHSIDSYFGKRTIVLGASINF